MSRRPSRSDRGSATLAAVGFMGVLLFLGVALAAITGVVHAHRAAQSAADLAALAAAGAVSDGRSACVVAGEVAVANGATMTTCRPAGREVTVQVRVAGGRWLGFGTDPIATARAGPAR